jgi:hypothetical protein
MRKKIPTEEMEQALATSTGSAHFRQDGHEQLTKSKSMQQAPREKVDEVIDQPVNQSTDRSAILGRPKSFYITEQQDENLDIAVKMLSEAVKGKVQQKVDRSILIRTLIEESNITSSETISRLASRLVSRLISQLEGR